MEYGWTKVIILGSMAGDPEKKNMQNGTEISSFSVAVRHPASKGRDAETSFFDVTAFGKTAEIVNRDFKKGSWVLVDAKMKQSVWRERSKIEFQAVMVQLLSAKEVKEATGLDETPSDLPF
jgi:single-strand DNA-binding protein